MPSMGIGLGIETPTVRKPVNPFPGITFSLRLEPNTVSFFQNTAGTVPATVDGTAVACWKDFNGLLVTQATAGMRPLLKIVSGTYFLRHDGLDDALTGTLGVANTGLVFRAKMVAGNAGGVYSDAPVGGSGTHQPFSDGNIYENFGIPIVNRTTAASGIVATNWYVYSVVYTGTNQIFRVNGVQKSSVIVPSANRTAFIIGNSNTDNATGSPYNGDISHVYVCPAANAITVENYLLGLP